LIVSGFVTSPFDHSRIWSGEAREIRIAEKLLTSSIGLLRAPCGSGGAILVKCERDRAGRTPAPRVEVRC
jgi:hypothetical protein